MSETLLTDGSNSTAAAQEQQAAAPAAEGTTPPAEGNQQTQAAAETKTAAEGTKPAEGAKGEENKAEGAKPIEYTEFTALAKEAGLPQEAAQKSVELGATMAQRLANQPQEILAQAREEWANQTKSDKEFGGDRLNENLAVAKKAMDAFGTTELKQLLDQSGFGNHPEVVRAFVKIGKALSEDALVVGSRTANAPKNPAQILYGNNTN